MFLNIKIINTKNHHLLSNLNLFYYICGNFPCQLIMNPYSFTQIASSLLAGRDNLLHLIHVLTRKLHPSLHLSLLIIIILSILSTPAFAQSSPQHSAEAESRWAKNGEEQNPQAAKASTSEFVIEFPLNEHRILRNFAGNAQALDSLTTLIRDLRHFKPGISSIVVSAQASPDGPSDWNRELILKRKLMLGQFLLDSCGVAKGKLTFNEKLPQKRMGKIYLTVTWSNIPEPQFTPAPATFAHTPATTAPAFSTHTEMLGRGDRILSFSSNLIELGMAIPNLTAEYRFTPSLSIAVSGSFSNWDYGKPTLKFRTISLEPELRWWPARRAQGLFTGIHYKAQLYNIAVGSERIQCAPGYQPARGGGLSVGYRFRFARDSRWRMEIAAGAGVYHTSYDKFQNRVNGLKIDEGTRLYVGPDNVAFSLVYLIPLLNK